MNKRIELLLPTLGRSSLLYFDKSRNFFFLPLVTKFVRPPFYFLIIFLFHACETGLPVDNNNKVSEDKFENLKIQIENLRNSSDMTEINQRVHDIERSIQDLKDDSLQNASLFLMTSIFLKNNDGKNFHKFNQKNLLISQKLSDSAKIGEAYWDRALFYSKNQDIEHAFINFSKAQEIYENIGFKFQSARMLLAIAIIQKNIKDYTGSEINTIRAIRIFDELGKYKQLYSGYNNLGIVYNELQEYDNALFYHSKAKAINHQWDANHFLTESTLNNIGVVYQNKGKHNLAIQNFEEALQNNQLPIQDPELYAMLIDNLAYSQFKLNEDRNIEEDLMRSLNIRDSINHTGGMVISNLRLSEFYIYQNDTAEALKFAKEAHDLAKDIQNNRDYLKSLLLISNLEIDGRENALKEYIRVNDSLYKQERIIRNKFTRIQYETDEFIAQNEQLNIQKRYMIAGFTGVTLLLILISVIVFLNRKNKELKLIQLQQKANEDIYNLMIESQSNIERGQEQEKKRISKELHDGILSQFFGVRLNLELLNDNTDQESAVKREKYIKELKALETEIRKVSHQLNSDLVSSDVSFINILQDLLKDQEDLGGYNGQIDFEGIIEWEKISPKVKINLFRIIQEALHNINKYAGASKVNIIFKNAGDELIVFIQDDGKGFEVENSHNGIGISNMKSRIKDLHGNINIYSDPTGTQISLEIPLKNELHESKNTFS